MCVKGTALAVKGQHSCGVSRGLYWLPWANTPVCPGDDVKGQHSCVCPGDCVKVQHPCVCPGDCIGCQGPTPLCVHRIALAVKGKYPVCVQGTALAVKGKHPVCVQGTALVIKGQHSRGLPWLSRPTPLWGSR